MVAIWVGEIWTNIEFRMVKFKKKIDRNQSKCLNPVCQYEKKHIFFRSHVQIRDSISKKKDPLAPMSSRRRKITFCGSLGFTVTAWPAIMASWSVVKTREGREEFVWTTYESLPDFLWMDLDSDSFYHQWFNFVDLEWFRFCGFMKMDEHGWKLPWALPEGIAHVCFSIFQAIKTP